VPGDFRCLTRITPDQVIAAARLAMNNEDAGETVPQR
jgi:hypothetical protein